MTLCGEPVHKAVGTAALLGLWISVPATIGYLLAQPDDVTLPPWTIGWVSLPGFAIIAPAAWLVAPSGTAGALARPAQAIGGVRRFPAAGGARMLYRAFS